MCAIKFYNGIEIPPIIMSTNWMDYSTMKEVVSAGLKTGFRAFDTARDYGNEHIVGKVLKECLAEQGLKREDIFITTKIGNGQQRLGNIAEQITCHSRIFKQIMWIVGLCIGLIRIIILILITKWRKSIKVVKCVLLVWQIIMCVILRNFGRQVLTLRLIVFSLNIIRCVQLMILLHFVVRRYSHSGIFTTLSYD